MIKMKIVFYSVREDERHLVEEFADKYHVDVEISSRSLSQKTVHLCENVPYISIVTTKVDEALVEQLAKNGVKYISTRTVGYDHIDLEACQKYGIQVGNVSYSLSSVAEYAVMLILMSLRNVKLIMQRYVSQDFSLKTVQGRELKDLTVGVVGTGRIGQEVIKLLSGFHCRILAYDVYPNDGMKDYVEYVGQDTLYQESDVITFHVPNLPDTHHMVNQKSLAKMKDNVVLINTARGSLIDSGDLIEAIENHQVGYAALDVVEDEEHIYYKDLKNQVIENRHLAILRSFPNVLLTPHTAFYTSQAVSDMIEFSITSCIAMEDNKENPWLVI